MRWSSPTPTTLELITARHEFVRVPPTADPGSSFPNKMWFLLWHTQTLSPWVSRSSVSWLDMTMLGCGLVGTSLVSRSSSLSTASSIASPAIDGLTKPRPMGRWRLRSTQVRSCRLRNVRAAYMLVVILGGVCYVTKELENGPVHFIHAKAKDDNPWDWNDWNVRQFNYPYSSLLLVSISTIVVNVKQTFCTVFLQA